MVVGEKIVLFTADFHYTTFGLKPLSHATCVSGANQARDTLTVRRVYRKRQTANEIFNFTTLL
jgi:hypothetical protein